MGKLTVFSALKAEEIDALEVVPHHAKEGVDVERLLSGHDIQKDEMDVFNHPRLRRALILTALRDSARDGENIEIAFETPVPLDSLETVYGKAHTPGLLRFLETSWNAWKDMGREGRDESGFLRDWVSCSGTCPPLVPTNMPLPRVWSQKQVPSQHVLGQVGYYATDMCTPVFEDLHVELLSDAGMVQAAAEFVLQEKEQSSNVAYILGTHPGHHAAADSFGGYCYVNHVAALTQLLHASKKIGILDVDYHCGNGTASIFDDNENVLVVSLHCHPDYEYPFHSGFPDDNGTAGTTLHLTMPPQTHWREYQRQLEIGLQRIQDFECDVLLVSLGLDTYDKDPCCLRRAGFCLQGSDYTEIGTLIAQSTNTETPIVFVQEGGYRMEHVGEAAANVVMSCCKERASQT